MSFLAGQRGGRAASLAMGVPSWDGTETPQQLFSIAPRVCILPYAYDVDLPALCRLAQQRPATADLLRDLLRDNADGDPGAVGLWRGWKTTSLQWKVVFLCI